MDIFLMGRLERHLDPEAVSKALSFKMPNNMLAKAPRSPVRKRGKRYDAYRAFRRNATRGSVWVPVTVTGRMYHGPVRPNRSRRWE